MAVYINIHTDHQQHLRLREMITDKITSVNLNVPEGKVKTVPENHCMIDTVIAVGRVWITK